MSLIFGLFCWTSAYAQTRDNGEQIWIPTTTGISDSRDKAVKLEATLYMPKAQGIYPVMVFNHGLVSGFSRVKYDEIAEVMVSRGIAVIMPMRRGLAGSEGSRNQPQTCDMVMNLAGVDHAIEDIDAVFAYVRANPAFNPALILIGGNSRGGVLSLLYAARRKPAGLKGVINFDSSGSRVGRGSRI